MSSLDQYSNIISALCVSHKVKRLYAFGSVLTDKFNGESDFDLIVDFESMDIELYGDNYFDLKFSLQEVLKRSVDLLEEKTITNPFFRHEINKHRKVVYEH